MLTHAHVLQVKAQRSTWIATLCCHFFFFCVLSMLRLLFQLRQFIHSWVQTLNQLARHTNYLITVGVLTWPAGDPHSVPAFSPRLFPGQIPHHSAICAAACRNIAWICTIYYPQLLYRFFKASTRTSALPYVLFAHLLLFILSCSCFE